MSIVHRNFIFIHIPKTAGTSIESIIGGSGHKSLSQIMKDGSDAFGHQVGDPPPPAVAFVRNPYDRMVSGYHFIRQVDYCELPASFEKFVWWLRDQNPEQWSLRDYFEKKLEHFAPQHMFIDFDGFAGHTQVYRFERLKEDWKLFCERFMIVGELPHTQRSRHRSWRTYYDSATKAIVHELYKTDFELFGYDL